MNAHGAKAIKEIVELMRGDFRGPDGYGGLSYNGGKKMEQLLIELAEAIKLDTIEP